MESNYSKGIIGTIIAVILFSGFYIVRSNIRSKVKNSAEEFLTAELDNWKAGNRNNMLINIIPTDFDGALNQWKNYKLSDYMIDDIEAENKYVRRRTFGRRRGLWYFLEKLSSSNVYVYADVELDMVTPDGFTKTFNIRYRLEPRGNGNFRVSKASRLKLF